MALVVERPCSTTELLERLTGRPAPGSLTIRDLALRFADVKEVRPDLVLPARGLPWAVLEVQHAVDETKRRRWPLAVSVLLDEHRAMGDGRWAMGDGRWAMGDGRADCADAPAAGGALGVGELEALRHPIKQARRWPSTFP
jgi:hypothetical protein